MAHEPEQRPFSGLPHFDKQCICMGGLVNLIRQTPIYGRGIPASHNGHRIPDREGLPFFDGHINTPGASGTLPLP